MNIAAKRVSCTEEIARREYPQVIKYMGSKAGIIDFVVEGITQVHQGGQVCDLFAGACSLAGAVGHSTSFVSNDIQAYSAVIAQAYLDRVSDQFARDKAKSLFEAASKLAGKIRQELPSGLSHNDFETLETFNDIEQRNRKLIETEFLAPYHLFVRYYSGTWWSAEQCLWIDALRQATDEFFRSGKLTSADKAVTLTAIMHAMAYCSQGTGHYAQYRDAKTTSSMRDIAIYRKKSFPDLFLRKVQSLINWNASSVPRGGEYSTSSMDFADRLQSFSGGTVYADPPYAFVHYSRFYHAIETLVLYDYPQLQVKGGAIVKGRYRENRHQSPFSIRSQVPSAFRQMFELTKSSGSSLVLSYSDTGLFDLTEMTDLALDALGDSHEVNVLLKNHKHMTMGRRQDRHRVVKEALLLAKFRG